MVGFGFSASTCKNNQTKTIEYTHTRSQNISDHKPKDREEVMLLLLKQPQHRTSLHISVLVGEVLTECRSWRQWQLLHPRLWKPWTLSLPLDHIASTPGKANRVNIKRKKQTNFKVFLKRNEENSSKDQNLFCSKIVVKLLKVLRIRTACWCTHYILPERSRVVHIPTKQMKHKSRTRHKVSTHQVNSPSADNNPILQRVKYRINL